MIVGGEIDPVDGLARLIEAGRLDEACAVLQRLIAAQASPARLAPVATTLVRRLIDTGAAARAVAVAEPLADNKSATNGLLAAYALALKALGRKDQSLAYYERAVAVAPQSAVAEHNLAAAFGDCERQSEAEAAARRALAKGGDAPETWLVLARALQSQDRFDEADAAYRAAIQRRPAYIDAQRELAQLIWMRTADVELAAKDLNLAIDAHTDDQGLPVVKAKLFEYAGDQAAALAVMEALAARPDAHPMVLATASQVAIRLDAARSLALAEAAVARAGPQPDSGLLSILCEAQLATGRADKAQETAIALIMRNRLDQGAIALLATAWRLGGDQRYRELYDYEAFVRPDLIDTPQGWDSREAYLADLDAALRDLHGFKTHPFGQSLRGGSQTSQSLRQSQNPAIKAFPSAVDGPIRRYMQAVGQGGDPLRLQNKGAYEFSGMWSVRLRPNGFHVDHIHPDGWLSSACYIRLPKAVESGGREGWIKFGEPGVPTAPHLPAEHFVQPKPGLLALFPSYMWHGTVPFSGEDERLTIAFDVVPA